MTPHDLLGVRVPLVQRSDHDGSWFLKIDSEATITITILSRRILSNDLPVLERGDVWKNEPVVRDSLSRCNIDPGAIPDEILHHISRRAIVRSNPVRVREI